MKLGLTRLLKMPNRSPIEVIKQNIYIFYELNLIHLRKMIILQISIENYFHNRFYLYLHVIAFTCLVISRPGIRSSFVHS